VTGGSGVASRPLRALLSSLDVPTLFRKRHPTILAHLVLLNGLRNRAVVYIQWISAWLTHSRSVLLIETDVEELQRGDPAQRSGYAD
jgi:hypothetical protein